MVECLCGRGRHHASHIYIVDICVSFLYFHHKYVKNTKECWSDFRRERAQSFAMGFNVPLLIFGSGGNPQKFHGVDQADVALMYLHSFSVLHSLSSRQR